jgi:hypothetical protein
MVAVTRLSADAALIPVRPGRKGASLSDLGTWVRGDYEEEVHGCLPPGRQD